jgi:hypothetical protein
MRAVCGLDVHKDSVFLCILHENGEKIHYKFGILTDELECMRDFLGMSWESHEFLISDNVVTIISNLFTKQ